MCSSDLVTFDLEFYDEYDALMLEIVEIESATELLLAETEQSIEVLETTESNETQTIPFSGFLFGLERFLPLQMADAAKPGEIDDLKIALGDAKQKLEELKADVVELKTQTPDEQTIRDLKSELKSTVEEIKSIIKNLEKAKLSAQATKLENIVESAENIGKVKSAEKQIGKWSDDDSELETDVYDSKGNKANLIVSYEKLNDHLVIFKSSDQQGLIVMSDQHSVLIDPIDEKTAESIKTFLDRNKRPPISTIIYSHSHWDRIQGSNVFEDKKLDIIAQKNCGMYLSGNEHTEISKPNIYFEDNYELIVGEEIIRLHYFGPSHGECMAVMELEKSKLLFIPDLIKTTGPAFPDDPTLPFLRPEIGRAHV